MVSILQKGPAQFWLEVKCHCDGGGEERTQCGMWGDVWDDKEFSVSPKVSRGQIRSSEETLELRRVQTKAEGDQGVGSSKEGSDLECRRTRK